MAQYVCKTRERVVCIRAFSLGPARTFKWRIVWLQDSYRFSFFAHDTLPVRHSSVITAVWKIDSRVIIWSVNHSHIVLHNPSSDRHIFLALDEWFFKSLSHSFSTSLAFVLFTFTFLSQVAPRENTWEQFQDDIQVKDGENDDCRYAVYDYDYVQQAEGTEASYR